jgi:type I restriction enzyme S subunit
MRKWERKRLRFVVTVRYGCALTDKVREPGPYPVYGSSGLLGTHKKYRYKGPAIIIGRKGNAGKIYYCPEDFWPIDTAYFINDCNKSLCSLKYLYHMLKTLHLDEAADGTAIPSILVDQINESLVVLPPLNEQDKVVHVLDLLEEKAELLARQNSTLLEMADICYRSIIAEGSSEDEQVPLANYAFIIGGQSPPLMRPRFFGGGLPFFKIPDMHQNAYVLKAKQTLSREGTEIIPGSLLPPGVVMVSCVGTVGLVGLSIMCCHTNQQIHSLIPRNPSHLLFLFCFARSLKEELLNMSAGSTAAPNVNVSEFEKVRVPYPSERALKRFNDVAEPLLNQVLSNQAQLINLRSMYDMLGPRLISQKMITEPKKPSKGEKGSASGPPGEMEPKANVQSKLEALVTQWLSRPMAKRPSSLEMLFQLRQPDLLEPNYKRPLPLPPRRKRKTAAPNGPPPSPIKRDSNKPPAYDFLHPASEMLLELKKIQSIGDIQSLWNPAEKSRRDKYLTTLFEEAPPEGEDGQPLPMGNRLFDVQYPTRCYYEQKERAAEEREKRLDRALKKARQKIARGAKPRTRKGGGKAVEGDKLF